MNAYALRHRPQTTLQKACPEYKAAWDAFDAAVARGASDDEIAALWARISDIAHLFWTGAEYATREIAEGRVTI